MTTNTILIIAAIIIGIIVVVKFLRFIIKGIILLAVLGIAIMVLMHSIQGTYVPSIVNAKVQTSAQNELNNINQKFKGFNLKQAESDFQNMLTKSIDSARKVLAKTGN